MASDRIKGGSRTKIERKPDHQGAAKKVKELLNDKSLSPTMRAHLTKLHGHLQSSGEKEKLTTVKGKSLDERVAERKVDDDNKKTESAQVKAHVEAKGAKVSTPQKSPETPQTMRDKPGSKLSGGVKQKLATGEGISIRDTKYGQGLDTAKKLKTASDKYKQANKPVEIIRAPGEQTKKSFDNREHFEEELIKSVKSMKKILLDKKSMV